MFAVLLMAFARRNPLRLHRGRMPSVGGASAPPPFATINAPSTADEGDDPVITATSADAGLSLELQDVSVGPTTIQTGVVSPYSTTYPDVTPGTRQVRFVNEANPLEFTSTANISVAPQAPSLDAPADEASFTIGDLVTFEATGTADGFDANTTKVEFYVDSVLVATALTDTAGVWTVDWDTTGATPGTNLSVVARRYWEGLAGETGTIDSTASVDIDLVSGISDPLTTLGSTRLLRWVEADLGITLNAGNVSDWADQSTNGRHLTQGTAANQPLYVASGGLNNEPYVDFDNANDFLEHIFAISGPSAADPTTILALVRCPTWTSNDDIISGTGGAANLVVRNLTTTPNLGQANSTAVNANNGLTLNTWGIVTAQYTNTVADFVKIGSGGSPVTGANAGSQASPGQRVGANRSGTAANVEVHAVMWVRGIITGAEFTDLYAYWNSKYGGGL